MANAFEKHRARIDAIDEEILKLVNRRAEHARAIGQLKNGTVYRPERETQILRRLNANNHGPLPGESLTRIFQEIMSACRAVEKPLSVAYLGPPGTYSEEAAIRHFGGSVPAMACSSIDETLRSVEAGSVDYAVVPVENSTEGAVGRTLDLLLQTPLKIVGEIPVAIHQCLLARQTALKTLRCVYSHPQSLAQCHQWLNQHLPGVARVNCVSNGEAAQRAAAERGACAIAGKRAAKLYGLKILAENIEDDPKNTTRFLVLGRHDAARSGRDKTSLVMTTKNRPGAMLELLAPLAAQRVSMTKLESRPSRTGQWEYVFFADIEGHQDDARVAKALAGVREKAAFLKVLGSYPAAL
ncbi:MAG: prephenate dehydratase [Burkholderiales bacterium]